MPLTSPLQLNSIGCVTAQLIRAERRPRQVESPAPRVRSAGPPVTTTAVPLLALQRASGNRAVATMVARQEMDAGGRTAAPPDPSSLTNQALLNSIGMLERTGSSAGPGAASEDRYRVALVERDQRVQAGHLWLRDAGATELLHVVGDADTAVVQPAPGDPRQARGASVSPVFSRGQLNAARGTRAAVAGGLSGALAAGAVAAAAGSVAPGVGTAIGFVVGVGAYMLIDWLAGDAVEAGVRAAVR